MKRRKTKLHFNVADKHLPMIAHHNYRGAMDVENSSMHSDAIQPRYSFCNTRNLFNISQNQTIPKKYSVGTSQARTQKSYTSRLLYTNTTLGTFLGLEIVNPYHYNKSGNALVYVDPYNFGIENWLQEKWNGLLQNGLYKFKEGVKGNIKTFLTILVTIVIFIITEPWILSMIESLGFTTTMMLSETIALNIDFKIVSGNIAGGIAGFLGGVIGSKLNGTSKDEVLRNGLKGIVAGMISGSIAGYYDAAWGIERVISQAIGGGISSKIMGGDFKRGFTIAGLLVFTQWGYSEFSKTYNTNGGKPHWFQQGDNNVGRSDLTALDMRSEEHWVMQGLGKYFPFSDAFAEFHDGLHDFSFMPRDQFSLIMTMPPSYALTVMAWTHPFSIPAMSQIRK